jgi:hypothetical protein
MPDPLDDLNFAEIRFRRSQDMLATAWVRYGNLCDTDPELAAEFGDMLQMFEAINHRRYMAWMAAYQHIFNVAQTSPQNAIGTLLGSNRERIGIGHDAPARVTE